MKIAQISARPLDMELGEPFGIATGAQLVAENVAVTLTLSDGTVGLGEAAPFPAVNGETQDDALAGIWSAGEALFGLDARRWRDVSGVLGDLGLPPSARCALESALLDAWCRHAGMSLWHFFGAAQRTLVTDLTLTTGTPEATRAAAERAVAADFSTLKVKVGGASFDHDVARLRAVAEVAPDASLLLDANASLEARAAIELVRSLGAAAARVVLFEQPTPADDLAGLRAVREAGIRVAADESARSLADVTRLHAERAVDVINLKITKCGVVPALDMALGARALGLSLMIGGMVESKLCMGVSACLAAGLGGFRFVDLDTPLFLRNAPTIGGWEQDGAMISVSGIEQGHGVTLSAC